jgi:menaquinone-specific isochorismate synthase
VSTRSALTDLNIFLRQARGQERFAWSAPWPAERLAGAGVAAELFLLPSLDAAVRPGDSQLFAGIESQARRLFASAHHWVVGEALRRNDGVAHPARPRVFGGFAFRPDFTPDNTWACFRPAHFVLPHYQLTIGDDEAWLTINALVPASEFDASDLDAFARDLAEALETRAALLRLPDAAPPVTQEINARGKPAVGYPMSPEAWIALVTAATDRIRAGEMSKVVLARACEARLPEGIDAADVLARLDERYVDCYRFLFEPLPHHAFFGASPELLVRRRGLDIETMALAGSAPRGTTEADDAALAAALLASPKDNHEHRLVSEMIVERLTPLTEHLNVPDTSRVLSLRNIHHLLTPVRGRLVSTVPANVLTLARALHPTPALGGVPVDRALAFIRDREPMPRGWYAAPVGWFDAALDGEFAVAIRSAIAQHDRAWLYAGAGIVADSVPEREWAETALKFRPMLEALGLGQEPAA